MIEKLYTVEEVAQLASVTGRTIRNYLKSGRLVGRKIGGQWRFPESEVQRLLTGGGAGSGAGLAPAIGSFDSFGDAADGYAHETAYEPSYDTSYDSAEPLAPVINADPARQSRSAPSLSQPVMQPAPAPVVTAPASGAEQRPAQPPAYEQAPRREQPREPYAPGQEPLREQNMFGNAPAQNPAAAPGQTQYGAYPGQGQPPQNAGYEHQASQRGPAPSYNTPAPLPSDAGVPPSPGAQPQPGQYPAYPGGYTAEGYGETYAEPYTETYDTPYEAQPEHRQEAPLPAPVAPEHDAAAQQTDAGVQHGIDSGVQHADPGVPALSDTGMKVLQFVAEVHDCSAGAQTCSVVEVIQTLSQAQATITQLANMAAQESQSGIPCECYVEFDERFSVARYTLFGSSLYLARSLQLLG